MMNNNNSILARRIIAAPATVILGIAAGTFTWAAHVGADLVIFYAGWKMLF